MIPPDSKLLNTMLRGIVMDDSVREAVVTNLAKQFDDTDRVERAIKVANEKLRRETAKHNDIVAAIKADIDAIQKTCPHIGSHYYPDAAGGSDSFYSCDTCGAQW